MRCPPSIGHFKSWRPFIFSDQLTLLCYIIIIAYYINKQINVAWWQACSAISFRTWARIPGPPLSQRFLFADNHMRIQACNLPCSLTHLGARWPMARSGGP